MAFLYHRRGVGVNIENIIKMIEKIENEGFAGNKECGTAAKLDEDLKKVLAENILGSVRASGMVLTVKEYEELIKELINNFRSAREI